MQPGTDPLEVRSTTRRVVELADFVRIDQDAVAKSAADLARIDPAAPAWDRTLHWSGNREQTANYILVLDTLNFCFWGEPRWRVRYRGQALDGYWALAAALKQALDRGLPLYDAAYLARIDGEQLAGIFAGENTIPLLGERVRALREVGHVLMERYDGQFASLIEVAGGSAARLVEIVAAEFSSFRDVARYKGDEVRFYKRAQILVSDLWGAFGGHDLGSFHDLGVLTAFADYKVPQVLHHLGILVYAPTLMDRLAGRVEIPAGSPEELEIRAATIWAVEYLRQALAGHGRALDAYQIDWLLWGAGQELPAGALPYHRTRTIYY